MTRKDVFLHRQFATRWNFSPNRLRRICRDQFSHSLLRRLLRLTLYFYSTRFWYFPTSFLLLNWDQNNNLEARNTQKYFRISSDKVTKKLWSRYGKLCICAYFACFMFSLLRFSREHTKIQNLCAATLRRTIMFNPQIESNCLWKSVMFHMCRCRRWRKNARPLTPELFSFSTGKVCRYNKFGSTLQAPDKFRVKSKSKLKPNIDSARDPKRLLNGSLMVFVQWIKH